MATCAGFPNGAASDQVQRYLATHTKNATAASSAAIATTINAADAQIRAFLSSRSTTGGICTSASAIPLKGATCDVVPTPCASCTRAPASASTTPSLGTIEVPKDSRFFQLVLSYVQRASRVVAVVVEKDGIKVRVDKNALLPS